MIMNKMYLIFGVLAPLSAIFQLYHGDQFQRWKKLQYPKRTTDHGQATGKLYHLRLRVKCTLFCNLKSQARTHAVLVIGLYGSGSLKYTKAIQESFILGDSHHFLWLMFLSYDMNRGYSTLRHHRDHLHLGTHIIFVWLMVVGPLKSQIYIMKRI